MPTTLRGAVWLLGLAALTLAADACLAAPLPWSKEVGSRLDAGDFGRDRLTGDWEISTQAFGSAPWGTTFASSSQRSGRDHQAGPLLADIQQQSVRLAPDRDADFSLHNDAWVAMTTTSSTTQGQEQRQRQVQALHKRGVGMDWLRATQKLLAYPFARAKPVSTAAGAAQEASTAPAAVGATARGKKIRTAAAVQVAVPPRQSERGAAAAAAPTADAVVGKAPKASRSRWLPGRRKPKPVPAPPPPPTPSPPPTILGLTRKRIKYVLGALGLTALTAGSVGVGDWALHRSLRNDARERERRIDEKLDRLGRAIAAPGAGGGPSDGARAVGGARLVKRDEVVNEDAPSAATTNVATTGIATSATTTTATTATTTLDTAECGCEADRGKPWTSSSPSSAPPLPVLPSTLPTFVHLATSLTSYLGLPLLRVPNRTSRRACGCTSQANRQTRQSQEEEEEDQQPPQETTLERRLIVPYLVLSDPMTGQGGLPTVPLAAPKSWTGVENAPVLGGGRKRA